MTKRPPTPDEGAARMSWWNSLTGSDREHWLALTGSARPEDAWTPDRRDRLPETRKEALDALTVSTTNLSFLYRIIDKIGIDAAFTDKALILAAQNALEYWRNEARTRQRNYEAVARDAAERKRLRTAAAKKRR